MSQCLHEVRGIDNEDELATFFCLLAKGHDGGHQYAAWYRPVPALDNAQEVIGYVAWDKKLHTVYRGRIYGLLPDAQKVRDNIVWHSRERYEVRGVVLV